MYDAGTMHISTPLLAFALVLSNCDVAKMLASKDAGEATSVAPVPGGLPQECVDYLELYKCVLTKNEPATAQSQVDGLRGGFQALDPTAAKKQCTDLMATSQSGFTQVGCVKGATSVAVTTPPAAPTPHAPSATTPAPVTSSKPAAEAVGSGPCKKGESRIQGVCRVHCMNPGYCKREEECKQASFVDPKEGPITDNYCFPAGVAPPAPSASPSAHTACPARMLRDKSGKCTIPTCTKDEDCSTHACSLVRSGVRVCSGSIDEVHPSEFR
jgi:hypothetical protein